MIFEQKKRTRDLLRLRRHFHIHIINRLCSIIPLKKKGECDDILIIKNGLITDTSFTNIVLENEDGLFTPTSYLLEGTKRRALLETGRIKETIVKPEDLGNYSKLYLINAMITLEDNISIPTSSVI